MGSSLEEKDHQDVCAPITATSSPGGLLMCSSSEEKKDLLFFSSTPRASKHNPGSTQSKGTHPLHPKIINHLVCYPPWEWSGRCCLFILPPFLNISLSKNFN
ncbi:hypothetical protein VPH35_131929 [Triticum aestivum]